MARLEFKVNGKQHSLDIDPDTPLLWVLRDHLNLTGTKYSCGIMECGACTVHLNGEAVRSCGTTAAEAAGAEILTIEGLGLTELKPLQDIWVEEEVSQCGFCQPGQIMTAASLLKNNPDMDVPEIQEEMSTLICRCGTYQRIKRAVARAAKEVR